MRSWSLCLRYFKRRVRRQVACLHPRKNALVIDDHCALAESNVRQDWVGDSGG